MRRLFGLYLLLACGGVLASALEDSGRQHMSDGESVLLAELEQQLAALPALPEFEPVLASAPELGQHMGQGLYFRQGSVALDGFLQLSQGPSDGLEVFACLAGGKNHETVMRLLASDAQAVKAIFIAALALSDGVPAQEMVNVPALGTPLMAWVYWQDVDPLEETETWQRIAATSLVRDVRTDRPYPPLPFVYTGSRIAVIEQVVDGVRLARERFMLGMTRSLAVNYNEPDALLASPFPMASEDTAFVVNSRISPVVGTPMIVQFEPARIPLTLELRANQLLFADQQLSDVNLQTLLSRHYAMDQMDIQRAIGVRCAQQPSRKTIIEVRRRLLRQAAIAQVWAVPSFIFTRS